MARDVIHYNPYPTVVGYTRTFYADGGVETMFQPEPPKPPTKEDLLWAYNYNTFIDEDKALKWIQRLEKKLDDGDFPSAAGR